MPTADMPLAKLKEYQGCTPCPNDFWDFWDRQKSMAYKFPLNFEMQPADIPPISNVNFYDLWFTGIDGGKIHAKYIQPVKETAVPLVLQFHGYPGASRGWFEQLSLVGLGMAVLAMECPGQGGYSEDLGGRAGTTAADHIIMGLDGKPENMYYVQTFLDTCLAVRIALQMEGIDAGRIYVNGGSQGGALGLVCTALNADVVKRCAAQYPFLSDYRRVWDMDRDLTVYTGLKYYTRWFDPEGQRLEEMFTKLGYIDTQNFVERIQCPVLFGTGLMDDVCPPSTQFAVYHKIQSPKKHLIFPEYTHEEIGPFEEQLLSFFGEKEDAKCLEQICRLNK